MTGKTIDEIKEIKLRFSSQYSDSLGGCGIGIGWDSAGNYCISVHFETKEQMRSSGMPDEFEGVLIRKQVTGPVIAF